MAEQYERNRDDDGRGVELVAALAADLSDGSRVLDAGCGTGVPLTETLADRHRVVGLDASIGMLDRAVTNVSTASFVQGDLAQLPFAADSFDALVSSHAVIYVPKAEHGQVYEEFACVLRPGGRALVVVGTAEWEGRNEDWEGWGVPMEWSIAAPVRTHGLFEAAGFETLASERVPDSLGGEWQHVHLRLPHTHG
jgi:ubiquinone/menaquinone biosynthesis C-methylase UbiE